MGEHFTGIITIGIGIVIVVTIVLLSQAGVLDNATRESIQSQLAEWGNTVVKNQEITLEGVNKLKEQISASGITSEINMTLELKDVNIGKKASQVVKDKNGENATYEVHQTQIMDVLEKDGRYPIPSGSTFTVDVIRTSDSSSQVLSNGFFRTNGKDSGSTEASFTSFVP